MANHVINVIENGTITLATSGKYCDRDIDVVIEVAGGGGGTELPSELNVLGNNLDYNGDWDWFFEALSKVTINTSSADIGYMFHNTKLEDLSHITINVTNASTSGMPSMFYYAGKLKYLPTINWNTANVHKLTHWQMCFTGCSNLRNIPEDYFMIKDENGVSTGESVLRTDTSGTNWNQVFYNCYSLRNIPKLPPVMMSSYYSSMFQNCFALDEIVDLPVNTIRMTSNKFSSFFSNCNRAKEMTFATQADGTPYSVEWKSQIIDLATAFGFTNGTSNVCGYNSGITTDKAVGDDGKYKQLKDDPDWFATSSNYSRYNRESAIRTINSLPDASAYLATATGSNTLKLRSACGELTDGGAISGLTEEQIAVATAKGWTVSFV